jgi:hypothetical protein
LASAPVREIAEHAGAGKSTVDRTLVPIAFASPVQETVHPLLIHAELVSGSDERSLDAAARIRERFLATS